MVLDYETLYYRIFGRPMPKTARPRMEQAVQGLPDRYRQVILSRLCGYTFERIASDMGISRQRVKQLESEAVRQVMSSAYYGHSNGIEYLGLSKPSYQALIRAEVRTTDELIKLIKTDKLKTIPGIGEVKMANIMKCLIEKGWF